VQDEVLELENVSHLPGSIAVVAHLEQIFDIVEDLILALQFIYLGRTLFDVLVEYSVDLCIQDLLAFEILVNIFPDFSHILVIQDLVFLQNLALELFNLVLQTLNFLVLV